MDLYSWLIVGWSMSPFLKGVLVIDAMNMATGRRSPQSGLIHHSDRGVQYARGEFRELLAAHGIESSMSRTSNRYHNAARESSFHTLETELVHHEHYRTRDEARPSVFDYIEAFYNRQRMHSTLDYCSPAEFEEKNAA